MATPESAQLVQIALRGDEDQFPMLLDVSSFLYDFNLLYEFTRIKLDDRYSHYRFSQHSWSRKNRPIRDEDRLRVVHLRLGSPIDLVAVVKATSEAIVAVGGLLTIAGGVSNWSLSRQNLKLQAENLKLQNEKLKKELPAGQAEPAYLPTEDSLAVRRRDKPWEELTAGEAKQGFVPPEESSRNRRKERDVDYYLDQTIHRLGRGVVRIREIDVEIISDSQTEKR